MIAYKSRYAAEIWFGGRQAAEIWLGDKLVWSGKRVPLHVLVDLGLISRAQLAAALGKAGGSEPELQLIASALALGEPGLSGSAQSEALAAEGLACRQAGQDSTAVLRLDDAQADGETALPGVLVGRDAVRLDPDAEPGSSAGQKAEKSAKLEENAADVEFGAGKSAEKVARLDKPFALPEAGPGGNVQAEKRLDAEKAAGVFKAGHKAERTARLDGLLTAGQADAGRKAEIDRALDALYGAGAFGAEIRAEKTVRADTLTAGAAFGQGFAGKKTERLDELTAAGQAGTERRAEIGKALGALYGAGRFGHGFAGKKTSRLDTLTAAGQYGAGRLAQRIAGIFSFAAMAKRGIGHCAQKTASVFDGFAAVKHGTGRIAQKTANIFSDSALARRGAGHKSRKQAVLELAEGTLAGLASVKSAAGAALEKGAAKVQRSGQIFAKVQREGLNLATKAKIRPEKQMQALAKLAARARAGLLGALGRKAQIQNEAGTRANALAAKSGRDLLSADARPKPIALALPVAILPKRLQGTAKAGFFALAVPGKADGEHLRGGVKMASADAVPKCVQGSALCGKQKTGSVLAAAKKACVAAAASVRQEESVYAVLRIERTSWTLPVVENGWLQLAQVKTAEVLNGWLVLDAVQGWEPPAVQDGWAQIVQVQDAKTENGWLVLDEAQETDWELPSTQGGWLVLSQAKEAGTDNGYLELR